MTTDARDRPDRTPDLPGAGHAAAGGAPRPRRPWAPRLGAAVATAAPYVLAAVAAYVALLAGLTFLSTHPRDGDDASLFVALLLGVLPAILLFALVFLACRWLAAEFRGRADHISTRHERAAFAAAVVVLAASWIVYGGVDGFLGRLHRPGDGAHGAGVVRLVGGGRPRDQVCAAAAAWSRYVRPELRPRALTGCPDLTVEDPRAPVDPAPFPGRSRAPIAILALATWIDSLLLVPAYAAALVLILLWSRRALDRDRVNLAHTGGDVVDRLRRFCGVMAIVVAFAALADWTENGLTLGLLARAYAPPDTAGCLGVLPGGCAAFNPLFGLGWWPAFAAGILRGATLLKVVGVTGAILYLIFLGVFLMQHGGAPDVRWRRLPGALRTVSALRVPILVVLVYYVLISYSQTPEILWQWRDYITVAAFGVGFTVLLAFGVRWLGECLLSHADEVRRRGVTRPGRYGWIGLIAALPLIAAVPIALLQRDLGWHVLKAAIPLALLGVVFVLSRFAQSWPHARIHKPGFGRSWLPGALGATMMALLGLSLLSAVTPLLLFTSLLPSVDEPTALRDPSDEGYWVLVILAIVLLVGAGRMGVLHSTDRPIARRLGFWWAVVGVGVGAWFLVALALLPRWGLAYAAPIVGPIGVVSLALLLMMMIGAGIIALVTLLAPPAPVFRVLRIAQTPVLLLVGLWWVLATVLPPADTLHDVRLQSFESGALPAATRDADPALGRIGERLDAAFAQWRWQNCLIAPSPEAVEPNPAGRPVVPLILLASDGGGIFAASWTAYVTDRVLGYGHQPATACRGTDPSELDARRLPRATRVFAASGISGGSVGLATYVVRSLDRTAHDDPAALQDKETCPDAPCREGTPRPRNPSCGPRPRLPVSEENDGWIRVRVGRCEALSPTLAWMLFAETPWSFIRTGLERDRAIVLEEAWERIWGRPNGQPHPSFFQLRKDEHDWQAAWAEAQGRARGAGRTLTREEVAALYERQAAADRVRVPLLLLNGTSVESGCRFNGSTLETNERPEDEPSGRCLSPAGLVAPANAVLAATSDLADMLCKHQDIRLSTVAILSARFPYISPSGHVKDDCPASRISAPETHVVDGGYLDGTGASTLIGLWHGLEPLIDEHNRDPLSRAFIVPFVIQIKNGYAEPAGPGAVPADPQFLAPPKAWLATFNANQAVSVQQMQLLFAKPFVPHAGAPGEGAAGGLAFCRPRFALFSLRAYPGPRGRSGWIFSNVAFNDLVRQFRDDPGAGGERRAGTNTGALDIVDSWLRLAEPGARPLSPASACVSANGSTGP